MFSSGPAGILVVAFLMYFAWLFFKNTIGNCCSRYLGQFMLDELELDESIKPYQETLDNDDRLWTLQEEKLMRDYGM